MNKYKRIIAIILIALSIYLIVSDEIEYSKLSFEEKVLNEMNFDTFDDERPIDKIVFICDTEDGYVCVATSSEEELINYGYLKTDGNKLSLEGKSFFSFPLIIYNDDPAQLFRINVLNSDNDYYFGCYQHKDGMQIIVNNSEIETHNFNLNYLGENYNIDFWFLRSEKEPNVSIKENQE